MTKPQIVLPPDVYDKLKASAEEHGGIGAGRFFEDAESPGEITDGAPLCMVGHLWRAGVRPYPDWPTGYALKYGIGAPANDRAVAAINRRKGASEFSPEEENRVSFDEWAAELNVVRGDA